VQRLDALGIVLDYHCQLSNTVIRPSCQPLAPATPNLFIQVGEALEVAGDAEVGKVYLYIDANLTSEQRQLLVEIGASLGLSVVVRDQGYVKQRSELSKPLAFISHNSRDKDSLVRDLAREMSLHLCSVWYDEYSLKVGDSLRENIERGLKEAKKCVVILSPNFISNGGWSKAEFDSIYTREIHEKQNVILPVWHNVDKSEVYEYCPRLVDRFALSSSIGVKKLAAKLADAIKE